MISEVRNVLSRETGRAYFLPPFFAGFFAFGAFFLAAIRTHPLTV